MKIGERIKALREMRKIKQGELAKAINVDASFLTKIESGKSDPTSERIAKIAEFLNVSTDFLILGKEESGLLNEEENEILNLFRKDEEINKQLKILISLKKNMNKIIIEFVQLQKNNNYANSI